MIFILMKIQTTTLVMISQKSFISILLVVVLSQLAQYTKINCTYFLNYNSIVESKDVAVTASNTTGKDGKDAKTNTISLGFTSILQASTGTSNR